MVLLCQETLQDHVLMVFVTLWVGAHQDKLPSFQVW